MDVIPEFNTEADWEWPYQFLERDPVTGATSPRAEWNYAEILVIYALANGTEVARASTSDGSLVVTDAAKRMVAVFIARAARPAVPLPTAPNGVMLTAFAYGKKGAGEIVELGRGQAVLFKGAKP